MRIAEENQDLHTEIFVVQIFISIFAYKFSFKVDITL